MHQAQIRGDDEVLPPVRPTMRRGIMQTMKIPEILEPHRESVGFKFLIEIIRGDLVARIGVVARSEAAIVQLAHV